MDTFLLKNIDSEKLFYDRTKSVLKSNNHRYITFLNVSNFISYDNISLVTKSYDKINNNTVILKILNKKGSITAEDLITEKLSHPNIISYLHTEITNSFIFIYMEKYRYDLTEYLIEQNKECDELSTKHFFKQMVRAVKYLHSNKIAHFDIKLENFLVSYDGLVKCDTLRKKLPTIILTDFGFATKWDDIPKNNDSSNIGTLSEEYKNVPLSNFRKGSWNYASPEMFFENDYPITSPDVWSLGVCLYIIATLEYPFYYENKDEAISQLKSGKYTFPEGMCISLDIRECINKILVIDPFIRPNIFTISSKIENVF